MGPAPEPEDRRLPLEARRQLPVQPAVGDADRPALGPVAERRHLPKWALSNSGHQWAGHGGGAAPGAAGSGTQPARSGRTLKPSSPALRAEFPSNAVLRSLLSTTFRYQPSRLELLRRNSAFGRSFWRKAAGSETLTVRASARCHGRQSASSSIFALCVPLTRFRV